MINKHCLVSVHLSLLLILIGCSDGSDRPQAIEGNVTSAPGTLDRTVLPTPNVVIVLIDDIGFGAADGFGGAIQTPTLDRLAADGLRFNQFHTTALCSPTRMAILTGRNHHSANAGSVMEVATAFQGNRGQGSERIRPVRSLADEFWLR